MVKRAISKNYFIWDHINIPAVFDQRIVNKYIEEKKNPVDSALDYNDIETKILIYDDRVKTWFLDVAKYLTIKNNVCFSSGENFDTNEAGFVILQIAISYIEGNQQYREGTTSHKKSKLFFKNAMKRLFPEISEIENIDIILNDFYNQVRCGLFHDGMTKQKVTINGEYLEHLQINTNNILINPYKFLDRIIEDFNNYISDLKDKNNKELRENFELRLSVTE